MIIGRKKELGMLEKTGIEKQFFLTFLSAASWMNKSSGILKV